MPCSVTRQHERPLAVKRSPADNFSGVDAEAFLTLLTPPGRRLLAAIGESDVSEPALLATATRLRADHPAELVSAALTQVRLRVRAVPKFGEDAWRMYFTPAGLEQATRASVAAHRTLRFLRGARPVLDLCCGIGGDLIARARAGIPGVGVDLDPLTVAVARANLDALGLGTLASVRHGDALLQDPDGHAAVFADPGRRSGGRRLFDPRAYQPPLDQLLELAGRAPAACVKVAPGIPYEAIPDGAETEWISDGGEVKEAALWLGTLAGAAARRATLLPSGATLTPSPGLGEPETGPWRRYLYEPDGAVIRAHLVAEVAAQVNGVLADPQIAYITSDTLRETPFARAYEIEEVMPFALKRLRAELRRRSVGSLTLKKRGSAVDLDRLHRDLKPSGPEALTVVLTRVGSTPLALLCRPRRVC